MTSSTNRPRLESPYTPVLNALQLLLMWQARLAQKRTLPLLHGGPQRCTYVCGEPGEVTEEKTR